MPAPLQQSSPALHRALLAVLVFLSGAASLIYEVLWLKELGLLFGSTAYAASTTLAVFFLGLAVGGAGVSDAVALGNVLGLAVAVGELVALGSGVAVGWLSALQAHMRTAMRGRAMRRPLMLRSAATACGIAKDGPLAREDGSLTSGILCLTFLCAGGPLPYQPALTPRRSSSIFCFAAARSRFLTSGGSCRTRCKTSFMSSTKLMDTSRLAALGNSGKSFRLSFGRMICARPRRRAAP